MAQLAITASAQQEQTRTSWVSRSGLWFTDTENAGSGLWDRMKSAAEHNAKQHAVAALTQTCPATENCHPDPLQLPNSLFTYTNWFVLAGPTGRLLISLSPSGSLFHLQPDHSSTSCSAFLFQSKV